MTNRSAPRGRAQRAEDADAPVFLISVAAELAGMHAQTLRQYDRIGLVTPQRTRGGGRRYSAHDVARLVRINQLSQQDGVSLAGVERILDLEAHVEGLQERVCELMSEVARLQGEAGGSSRMFAVGRAGEVIQTRVGQRPRAAGSGEVVLWRQG